MLDGGFDGVASAEVRAGLRVSAVSIGWTLSSSLVAGAVGARSGSVVLVGFGLTGLLDAAGSATLVGHFWHALRYDAFSVSRERRSLRLISLGLLAVATLTGVQSARQLAGKVPSRAAPAGLVIAAMSVVVLAILSGRKRRVGRRIPSRALMADGWLSATGCLLAMVTVAGTGLTSAFGWWWVDPAAAAIVACGAVGIAVVITWSASKPQNFRVER